MSYWPPGAPSAPPMQQHPQQQMQHPQQMQQHPQHHQMHQQPPPGANPAYFQARPPNYGGPPQNFGGPPQNFGCPPGIDPQVFEWFKSVDRDRSNRITCGELQMALTNANWTHFNAETCRLMVSMFDRDGSGQIELHEFQALWNYIQQWRGVFERYDRDRSGSIDSLELQQAWGDMGYRVSPQFTNLVVARFDTMARRGLTLDNFIQASVMLKSLTDAFRVKDTRQCGQIQIGFEEFLVMVLTHK